jgi:hypothetical protein
VADSDNRDVILLRTGFQDFSEDFEDGIMKFPPRRQAWAEPPGEVGLEHSVLAARLFVEPVAGKEDLIADFERQRPLVPLPLLDPQVVAAEFVQFDAGLTTASNRNRTATGSDQKHATIA